MELEVHSKMELSIEIRDVYARKILDFSGNPAIEVEVLAGEKIVGKASMSELAYNVDDKTENEIEDRIENQIEEIHSQIASALVGANGFAQHEIDRILQETGGSVFAVSLAVARAAAAAEQVSLYRYLGGVRAIHPKIPVLIEKEQWNQKKEKEIRIRPEETLTSLFERILEEQNQGTQMVLVLESAGTEDSFPADLAVAANLPKICAGNRQSAYYTVLNNRLLQLEEKLRN